MAGFAVVGTWMNVAMLFNIQGLGYVEAFRKATANFNEDVHAPTRAC